jgi:hypothetical protein
MLYIIHPTAGVLKVPLSNPYPGKSIRNLSYKKKRKKENKKEIRN